MNDSPAQYLITRFTDDANALHQRAESLKHGKLIPGPDIKTSEKMAAACDDVVDLITDAIEHTGHLLSDNPVMLLSKLEPVLEQRALQHKDSPPVRSVYAGAIVRLREMISAENNEH